MGLMASSLHPLLCSTKRTRIIQALKNKKRNAGKTLCAHSFPSHRSLIAKPQILTVFKSSCSGADSQPFLLCLPQPVHRAHLPFPISFPLPCLCFVRVPSRRQSLFDDPLVWISRWSLYPLRTKPARWNAFVMTSLSWLALLCLVHWRACRLTR